jgi:hypothetical protein
MVIKTTRIMRATRYIGTITPRAAKRLRHSRLRAALHHLTFACAITGARQDRRPPVRRIAKQDRLRTEERASGAPTSRRGEQPDRTVRQDALRLERKDVAIGCFSQRNI